MYKCLICDAKFDTEDAYVSHQEKFNHYGLTLPNANWRDLTREKEKRMYSSKINTCINCAKGNHDICLRLDEFCDCPCHGPKDNPSKLPPDQGKRDVIRPRHDLIPLAFLDELASIFEEGRAPRPGMPDGYGDSWKMGGEEFLIDCLNHASNHLHLYMEGDRTENHLSKVAWNVLCVRWHVLKQEKEKL